MHTKLSVRTSQKKTWARSWCPGARLERAHRQSQDDRLHKALARSDMAEAWPLKAWAAQNRRCWSQSLVCRGQISVLRALSASRTPEIGTKAEACDTPSGRIGKESCAGRVDGGGGRFLRFRLLFRGRWWSRLDRSREWAEAIGSHATTVESVSLSDDTTADLG